MGRVALVALKILLPPTINSVLTAYTEKHSYGPGPPDSGLKRYTTSTLGQLAFIGGCQRARIDQGTRPLAAPNES